MAGIDAILNSLKKQALKDAELRTRNQAQQYGREAKQQVFQMIRQHPVSQELKNHSQNSAFLGRRGSLFGFLGFHAGTDPVEELIAFLDKFWTLEVKKELTISGFKISIKMDVPTRTELKQGGLVLPWLSSRAWPYAIEEAISNLPYFLNVKGGLSGEGVQASQKTIEKEFTGVPYLSQIWKEARPVLRKKKFKIQ